MTQNTHKIILITKTKTNGYVFAYSDFKVLPRFKNRHTIIVFCPQNNAYTNFKHSKLS